MIPKNIFQTQRSQEYVNKNSRLKRAQESWKKHTDFKYHFYNDEEMDMFIKSHFDKRVNDAYNRCPMKVMKADMWRYCVIYTYGGIYADADAICAASNPTAFIKDNAELVIAPENDVHLCQWTFAAPANSPILKAIIDLSVERILEIPEIRGEHIIHHLTGPGVFTDGIEDYLKANDLPTFTKRQSEYLNYPNHVLFVYSHYEFHHNLITHLFSSRWPDGWCDERVRKLMN